jgi:hypothetical protein
MTGLFAASYGEESFQGLPGAGDMGADFIPDGLDDVLGGWGVPKLVVVLPQESNDDPMAPSQNQTLFGGHGVSHFLIPVVEADEKTLAIKRQLAISYPQ